MSANDTPALQSNGIGWTKSTWSKTLDSWVSAQRGCVLCCGFELSYHKGMHPMMHVVNSKAIPSNMITIYLPEDSKALRLVTDQLTEIAELIDEHK